jgi:hypothetical protein
MICGADGKPKFLIRFFKKASARMAQSLSTFRKQKKEKKRKVPLLMSRKLAYGFRFVMCCKTKSRAGNYGVSICSKSYNATGFPFCD